MFSLLLNFLVIKFDEGTLSGFGPAGSQIVIIANYPVEKSFLRLQHNRPLLQDCPAFVSLGFDQTAAGVIVLSSSMSAVTAAVEWL